MRYSEYTLQLARQILDFVRSCSKERVTRGPFKGSTPEDLMAAAAQAIEVHHPNLTGLVNIPFNHLCLNRGGARHLIRAFYAAVARDREAHDHAQVNLNHLSVGTQERLQAFLLTQQDPAAALEQLVLAGLSRQTSS